uniref:Uncharacterized protein n=1 Tax=Ditylenchus dipsaci TaxID=166011 RepID=A0A915CPB6_9BILA
MVYRFIRQLLNDERVIQKMADSSFMRQAARYFVSSVYRFRGLAENNKQLSNSSRRITRFSKLFKEEWKKALDKSKELKG